MDASPIHVFLVDDLAPLREALALFLGAAPGFACVGTAGSAEAALAAAPDPAPDVVLLDVGLPGRSGLDVLPELKAR